MKLLFDENLSRKLVARLADLWPDSVHVLSAGLANSPDILVWEHARANGLVIVTTDGDFFDLAMSIGPPPKVIWLREWRSRTKDAEYVLRREAIRIAEFTQDSEQAVLVLKLNVS